MHVTSSDHTLNQIWYLSWGGVEELISSLEMVNIKFWISWLYKNGKVIGMLYFLNSHSIAHSNIPIPKYLEGTQSVQSQPSLQSLSVEQRVKQVIKCKFSEINFLLMTTAISWGTSRNAITCNQVKLTAHSKHNKY